MRLSKREVTLLIVLGMVAILVLGINFLVLPLSKEFKAANMAMTQKKDEMITAKSDIDTAGAMGVALDNAYQQTKKLTEPYNNSMKQEEIDIWLNELLAQNNLAVQNMDISDLEIAVTDFKIAAISDVESLPIQDAADVVNGTAPTPAPTTAPTGDGEQGDAVDEDMAAVPEQAPIVNDLQTALYQINVIINCTGSTEDIIAFSNSLYASGRALRLTSFTTQQAKEDGSVPAVITIAFYGIPPVDDVSAVAAAK
ncbi:MAG: hypothetical protein RR351_01785 [Christensenella sp.]